jgi:hypothetical protein
MMLTRNKTAIIHKIFHESGILELIDDPVVRKFLIKVVKAEEKAEEEYGNKHLN